MIGLIFDGKNFGVYFCFSYKSFGFSLSVNICGGFYKKYKTVYNFYNDKNIVSYSISFFDFLSGRGYSGKYKGFQINIPLLTSKLFTIMVSSDARSKMYVINAKTLKSKIKALVKSVKNIKKIKVTLKR